MNLAVLSSHNGSGFCAIHQAVLEQKLPLNIQLLVSNNSFAPVLQRAKEFGVDHYVINAKNHSDPDSALYELLKANNIDLIFLSGYMKKIAPKITQEFTIINSHPSLLPKYGGAGMYGTFVHQAVIQNGEKESGVTIHKVNEEYDKGEIILQEKLSIEPNESVASLENRIKALEKETIIHGLQKFLDSLSLDSAQ